MLQTVVNTMDAEEIIHNWSDFSSGESEFSEESNQWNARHVTLIGFDKQELYFF